MERDEIYLTPEEMPELISDWGAKLLEWGNEIANTATDKAIKEIAEWGDEDCDCPKNEFPTQHGHTKRHYCWKCWQALKKLVEVKI